MTIQEIQNELIEIYERFTRDTEPTYIASKDIGDLIRRISEENNDEGIAKKLNKMVKEETQKVSIEINKKMMELMEAYFKETDKQIEDKIIERFEEKKKPHDKECTIQVDPSLSESFRRFHYTYALLSNARFLKGVPFDYISDRATEIANEVVKEERKL